MTTYKNTKNNAPEEGHANAMAYIKTVMNPFANVSGIPDGDTTPHVLKNIVLRGTFDAPDADFAVVPILQSDNPRIEVWVAANNSLIGSYNAGDMILYTVFRPHEEIADSFDRMRFVSGATRLTSDLHSAGDTNISGSLYAAQVYRSPDKRNLSIANLHALSLSNESHRYKITEGACVSEHPRPSAFQKVRHHTGSAVNNRGAFNAEAYEKPPYAPTYSYTLGEENDNVSLIYPLKENNTPGRTIGRDNLPKSLSSRLLLSIRGNMRPTADPTWTGTSNTVRIYVDVLTATASKLGTVTIAAREIMEVRFHGNLVPGNGDTNFYSEKFIDLCDSLRSEGTLVGFTLRSNTSASRLFNGVMTITDIGYEETEKVTGVVLGSGTGSDHPISIEAVANYEATPNETLARQLKAEPFYGGTEYLEHAQAALFTFGLHQAIQKAEATTSHPTRQQAMALDNVGTNAYAWSWGSLWNFVKPAMRAMVKPVSHQIGNVIGQRFERPFEDLGNAVFAKGGNRALAMSGETVEPADYIPGSPPGCDNTGAAEMATAAVEAVDATVTAVVKCNKAVATCTSNCALSQDAKSTQGCKVLAMDVGDEMGPMPTGYAPNPFEDDEDAFQDASPTLDDTPSVDHQRGDINTASFRNAAAKGDVRGLEYSILLEAVGAHVPVVAFLPDEQRGVYGMVSVTKTKIPGMNYTSQNTVGGPDIQYSDLLIGFEDMKVVVTNAMASDIVHPVFRKADQLYVTLRYRREDSKQPVVDSSGSSHQAALLLALMGRNLTMVVSAGVSFTDYGPQLTPVTGIKTKSTYCEKNGLRLVVPYYKYEPSGVANMRTQFDLDIGTAHDGRVSVFGVASFGALCMITALPSSVKGSVVPKSKTSPEATESRISELAEKAIPLVFNLDGKEYSYNISNASDLEPVKEAIRTATGLTNYEVKLANVIGQINLNDLGGVAQPGEKSTRTKIGVKDSFMKTIKNLDKAIQDKKDQQAKKKGRRTNPFDSVFNDD